MPTEAGLALPPGISQATYDAVQPYADKSGVPDTLWMAIALMESSGNPRARNGNAYGLFQLLTPGGQGQAAINAGHKIDDLYNPAINAEYAMPRIAYAWNALGGKGGYTGDANWFIKFASLSGHPNENGNIDAQTTQAGTAMFNFVEGFYRLWQGAGNLAIQTPGQIADNVVKGVNAISTASDLLNSLTIDNIRSALVKSGVFIVAIVLIISGFVALENK